MDLAMRAAADVEHRAGDAPLVALRLALAPDGDVSDQDLHRYPGATRSRTPRRRARSAPRAARRTSARVCTARAAEACGSAGPGAPGRSVRPCVSFPRS